MFFLKWTLTYIKLYCCPGLWNFSAALGQQHVLWAAEREGGGRPLPLWHFSGLSIAFSSSAPHSTATHAASPCRSSFCLHPCFPSFSASQVPLSRSQRTSPQSQPGSQHSSRSREGTLSASLANSRRQRHLDTVDALVPLGGETNGGGCSEPCPSTSSTKSSNLGSRAPVWGHAPRTDQERKVRTICGRRGFSTHSPGTHLHDWSEHAPVNVLCVPASPCGKG